METKVTVNSTPFFTALVMILAVIFSSVSGTTDPSDGKALMCVSLWCYFSDF